MGTTIDKLTYLATTKTKIKDAINLGNANITTETFRQYENKIKQAMINTMNDKWGVWNNFDKVIGTGETLTLNNTEYALMQVNLKGNTSQASEPTPDSPVDINVVSGDNTIEICGKNLFDKDNSNIVYNVRLYANGTYGSDADANGYYVSDYIKVNANQNIAFSETMVYPKAVCLYDENKASITRYQGSTLTTINTGNASYIRFGGKTSSIDDMQVEYGTSSSEYEAYTGNSYLISLGVENLLPNNATSQTIGTIDFTKNNDGSIYANGTANAQTDLYILGGTSTYVGLGLSAGTYTLSGCASGGSNTTYLIGCVVQHSDTTTTLYADYGTGSTIQVQTGDKFRIFIRVLNGKSVDGTFYPQLEKGSKKNSYTPYGTTPIELCKIGNYQDFIREGTGKNLFDKDNNTISNKYLSYDGSVVGANDWLCVESYLEIKPNTSYIASMKNMGDRFIWCEYDSNKQTIGTRQENTTGIMTTSLNAKYIRFCTNDNTATDIMLEKGSQATQYEPYGFKDKWYLHKEIGKVVLNGSEAGWTKSGSYSNSYFINASDSYSINISDTNIYVCCNYYKSTYYSNVVNYDYTCILSNNKNIMIHNKDIDNLPDFKTWLSTHNTDVYYVLATPTNTEITDSTLISQLEKTWYSYKGQTNISQENNDKPFIITATALEDIS